MAARASLSLKLRVTSYAHARYLKFFDKTTLYQVIPETTSCCWDRYVDEQCLYNLSSIVV